MPTYMGAVRDVNQPSLPPVLFQLTGTSSYPAGGYDVQPQWGDIGTVKGIDVLDQNTAGTPFELRFNKGTKKLQAYRKQGLVDMVIEEVVTVASNLGTLANVPAYILAVQATAGSVTGAFKTIPTGATPLTKQVAVTFPTGGLTFLGTDAVTAAKVTYIPMGIGPFIPANQVIDELVTLNSSGVNLANQASLVQYVYDALDVSNPRPAIINAAGSPATHQIAINLDNSTNTTLTSNAAQSGHAGAKVTYWKRSAFGAPLGYTAQANIAVSSNAIKLSTVLGIYGIFVPCFGEVLVGLTAGPAFVEEVMEGPSGSVAANVAVYNPALQKLSFNAGDSLANIEAAFISFAAEFNANLPEIPAGTSLTGMVWDVAVYGTP